MTSPKRRKPSSRPPVNREALLEGALWEFVNAIDCAGGLLQGKEPPGRRIDLDTNKILKPQEVVDSLVQPYLTACEALRHKPVKYVLTRAD